jgi:hypothetical protein
MISVFTSSAKAPFCLQFATSKFRHFAAQEVDKLDRSIDCQTQPANQEIEVSFANADKLNSQRHIEVLVGSKDGCFVIGQQIPLYAIKRSKASREIIERERRALVRIQNIKKTSFGELVQRQKDYVVQKFGPQESKVIFNHVKLTLIKLLPNEE